MSPIKLGGADVAAIVVLLCLPLQLVESQYTTATSIVNGQAQWQGRPVATNPTGIPTLVSNMVNAFDCPPPFVANML